MSEQEILEGNKLIAEFMGEKLHVNTKEENEFYVGFDEIAFDIQFLKYDHSKVKGRFTERVPLRKLYYHTSWDWLMRVVEKIENIGVDVEIHGITHALDKINLHSCRLYYSVFNTVTDEYFADEVVMFKYNTKFNRSKINCVYEAVVEFIKWYNQQNK